MIESALKVLDERENVVYNKRILTNSREDIAEMLYTSEIDAVKYRSDEG
jgi:hypothetical protein